MDKKTDETTEEMQLIGDMLDSALEYGLEVEVIYWALRYIKENPDTSPAQAFALGVTEWIK
jgi:hypothetical protein